MPRDPVDALDASFPASSPLQRSVLAGSAGGRLAVVAVIAALLWAAVAWALQP